jgi:hypothetical protein
LANTLNSILIDYFNLTKVNLNLENTDLDELPILACKKKIIPKSNVIAYNSNQIKYSFHGIGCYFEYQKQIIDFDYYPKVNDRIDRVGQ